MRRRGLYYTNAEVRLSNNKRNESNSISRPTNIFTSSQRTKQLNFIIFFFDTLHIRHKNLKTPFLCRKHDRMESRHLGGVG
jgi:hypothetical protein